MATLPKNFNEAEYLKLNPDVAKAVATGAYGLKSGADHYLSQGITENRTYQVGDLPTVALPKNFDEKGYLAANPDVAKAVASGQVSSGAEHYSIQGGKEGREAPTVQQPTLQAPTVYDPSAQINALKAAQKAQAIAQLGAKRDTSMSNLNAEQAKITPAYYNKRSQTSTASQLGAKSFAEYMANRGQTSAGVSSQNELNRIGQLQGDIGALNQQELAANGDVQRRMTDVGNAYASDIAAADAGIEANAMNQLIAAQQQAYQNALSQYNADRGYNYQVGRDTVTDNRYNTQYADSRADVNYDRTYQAGRDTVADNRYNEQFNYQKSQDSLVQNNWQSQFDYTKLNNQQQYEYQQAQFEYQKQQDAINNAYKQGSFEWQKAMDQAGLELQQKQFELQKKTVSSSNSNSTTQERTTSQGNNATVLAWGELQNQINAGTAPLWLERYKASLKDTIGTTEYNKMVKTYQDVASQMYSTQQDYRISDKQRMIMEGQ